MPVVAVVLPETLLEVLLELEDAGSLYLSLIA
jgi:hypothetical protein